MVARIIALEEHFWTPALIALRRTVDQVNPKSVERLGDLGALRLREMDAGGIDMQVLSEAEPGAQNLAPDQAVPLARASNDLLADAVKRHPDRFAGFATLPTPDPAAAAKELERTVRELSFRGAMVHGSTRGHFLDERQFWPIFESAAALDVPIYLHPCTRSRRCSTPITRTIPNSAARPRLRHRDGGAGRAPHRERRVRRISQASDHPGSSRRGAAVPVVARQHTASRRSVAQPQLPRIFRRSFPHHHIRKLLAAGPANRARGAGHRAHSVRGRLAVSTQRRGGRLHQGRQARARRPRANIRPQCPQAVAHPELNGIMPGSQGPQAAGAMHRRAMSSVAEHSACKRSGSGGHRHSMH